MKRLDLYEKIREIAKQLMHENETFSRADLAFELKKYGVTADTLEVSKLIFEAYQYYKQDGSIKYAFITNDGTQQVVNDYEVHGLLETGSTEELAQLTNEHLCRNSNSLNNLQKVLSLSLGRSSENKSNIMGNITGTKGISDVQSHAISMYNAYSKLVDGYALARQDVKTVMTDFVTIREDVQKIYTEYSAYLLDIFGDAIRKVAPQMFDFDSIEFLNVEGMLQQVKLEFDQLSEKCATLMGEISDSFSNSLNQSVHSYKSVGNNKGLGLAIASVVMINHYLDVQEKKVRCQQELESLKQLVKRDAVQIRADYARLASIYKTLNDLYIPKANAFYRFGDKVLSSELEYLLDSIYQNPEIKRMVKERDEIINKIKELQHTITDNRLCIDYYRSSVGQAQNFLQMKDDEYQMAKSRKPSKPFFLFNLLSFGKANERYNRNMYEWKINDYPVIQEYEKYKEDIHLDKEELLIQQNTLESNTKEYYTSQLQLKQYNKRIREKIQIDNDIKNKFAKHLESIIGLLHIAKSILESKLDEHFIKTVQITDYTSTQLPNDIKNCIHAFTEELREENYFSNDSNQSATEGKEVDLTPQEKKDLEMMQQLTDHENEAIQKAIGLFEEWSNLQVQKESGKIKSQYYEQQLHNIQDEFDKSMKDIDNQSIFLKETLKRINIATNNEELVNALLSLSNGRISLTEKDIDDFLKGNKQFII